MSSARRVARVDQAEGHRTGPSPTGATARAFARGLVTVRQRLRRWRIAGQRGAAAAGRSARPGSWPAVAGAAKTAVDKGTGTLRGAPSVPSSPASPPPRRTTARHRPPKGKSQRWMNLAGRWYQGSGETLPPAGVSLAS